MKKLLSSLIFPIILLLTIPTIAQDPWTVLPQVTTNDLTKLHFVNADTGWVVGDLGTIIKTTDGGNSWEFQPLTINAELVDIYMLNPDTGWAVAEVPPFDVNDPFGSYLLKTTNGGANWDSLWFPEILYQAVHFIDDSTGWIGGLQGFLAGSTDGGDNWFEATFDSGGFSGFNIFHIEFNDPMTGYALGGRFDLAGTTWRTTNGGASWKATNIIPEPIRDIEYFSPDSFMVVSGDFDFGSGFATSGNGGDTWDYTYLGIWGYSQALGFRTDQEAWVPLGFSGGYMITYDGGQNWSSMPSPENIGIYDVVFIDENTGYMVGDAGTILKYDQEVGIPRRNRPQTATMFSLLDNYPNPFNPGTTIRFSLEKPAAISLRIYDITGREVRQLDWGKRPAGLNEISFDAKRLASGLYFYRLTATSATNRIFNSAVHKMMLLK